MNAFDNSKVIMIPRQCDIVKKTSSMLVIFCVVLVSYHFIFSNNVNKCQSYEINKRDTPVIQNLYLKNITGNKLISIYSQNEHTKFQSNGLKALARDYQQKIDQERYGSHVSKRQNITDYCHQHIDQDDILKEANENVGRTTQLVYFDFAHSFLFCQMQKVGSSTWNRILLRIREIKNVQQYQEEESKLGVVASRKRHFLRDTMYNLPNGFDLDNVLPRLVSFTFTRHPFSRLVSAYNSKIRKIVDPSDKYYNKDIAIIQSNILQRYRTFSTAKDPPYPTPREFIQYLIREVEESGPMSLNPHFKPQYCLCPFCSVDFDFIGDLEYMKNDIQYLGKLLNIQKQMTLPNMNENSHTDFDGFISEEEFFKSVPKDLVVNLYDNVYKPDFSLLSYPYPSYYINLGGKI